MKCVDPISLLLYIQRRHFLTLTLFWISTLCVCLCLQILGYADYAFTSIFTVEILLKVKNKNSLKLGWNPPRPCSFFLCCFDTDTFNLCIRWRSTERSSIRARSAGIGSTCWICWSSASLWSPSSCSQYQNLIHVSLPITSISGQMLWQDSTSFLHVLVRLLTF